jgi:AcrR family transcriptional regulator
MSKKKKQFSKEMWLQKALKQLSKKGNLGLTIEELSKAIGVTKGSFYWHFKSRYDFTLQLFDYWGAISTANVMEHVNQEEGDASERLLRLTTFLVEKDICRYELAVRSWVQIHPVLIPLLKQIDLGRYEFVAALFKEMGFTGDDLEMRVRTFLVFYSLEMTLYPTKNMADRMKFLELRHSWLTGVKNQ